MCIYSILDVLENLNFLLMKRLNNSEQRYRMNSNYLLVEAVRTIVIALLVTLYFKIFHWNGTPSRNFEPQTQHFHYHRKLLSTRPASPPPKPSILVSTKEESGGNRGIYGGKIDKAHLGGFLEKGDQHGISNNTWNFMMGMYLRTFHGMFHYGVVTLHTMYYLLKFVLLRTSYKVIFCLFDQN